MLLMWQAPPLNPIRRRTRTVLLRSLHRRAWAARQLVRSSPQALAAEPARRRDGVVTWKLKRGVTCTPASPSPAATASTMKTPGSATARAHRPTNITVARSTAHTIGDFKKPTVLGVLRGTSHDYPKTSSGVQGHEVAEARRTQARARLLPVLEFRGDHLAGKINPTTTGQRPHFRRDRDQGRGDGVGARRVQKANSIRWNISRGRDLQA